MKKPFTLATTILALLLSASVGVGLYALLGCAVCCYDSNPSRHPILFPFCLLSGCAALTAFFIGFWKYVERRIAHPSLIGVIVDVLYSVILVPGFFLLYACAAELGRRLIH